MDALASFPDVIDVQSVSHSLGLERRQVGIYLRRAGWRPLPRANQPGETTTWTRLQA